MRTHRIVTAAAAADVLAAAGASAIGQIEDTTVAKPRVESTPAVAPLATPNTLYGATGARPVVVSGPTGSLGIGSGPFAVASGAPRGAVPVHATDSSAVKLVETFFAPTIYVRPATAPARDTAVAFVAANAEA